MKLRSALSAAAVLMAGCGEPQPMEGGFETPDLQAKVSLWGNAPAAGARVWLVRSRGDTAPADVLDSAWSDSSGVARFPGTKLTDRSGLGVEAYTTEYDGLMWIAPNSLATSDSVGLPMNSIVRIRVLRSIGWALPKLNTS